VDGLGDWFIAEPGMPDICEITTDGIITIAGFGMCSYDDFLAEKRLSEFGRLAARNQTTKRSQSLRKPGGRVVAPSRFRQRVRSPTAQHPVPATTATGIPAGCPGEGQRSPTYIRRSSS
jgi:hypothetical protein